MTARILNDPKLWDSFIDQSPYGLLFHKWDFLKITERHTGYTFLPYGVYKGSELICLFPLFSKRVNGLHVILSPPPLQGVIPYLGFVVGKEFDTLKQSKKVACLDIISTDMESELAELNPHYFSARLVPGFNDIRHFLWNHYSPATHYTYIIDVTRPLDEIWNNFNYKLRVTLRKLESAGMHLEKGEDISPLYNAVSKRFSSPVMGVPMICKQFFTDLFAAYPQELGAYYLYDRDDTLVATLATQEYKRFSLWIGMPKMGNTFGNEYLEWLLIQKAKSSGFSECENIGANNQNLNQFKVKFNPDLSVFFEISKKDATGRMAEWLYSHIINQNWIKRKVVPYIE